MPSILIIVSSDQVYEMIGVGYSVGRRPDPRWLEAIDSVIGDAERVINIGAGTGSYEPSDRAVIAVEPSWQMVSQRSRSSAPVVMALAENVPIASGWADLAMTLLSLHHWTDWRAGIAEMRRLAPRRLVLTYDPELHASFWLLRDYLPEIAAAERTRAPRVEDIADALGGVVQVIALEVPWDCVDGVLPAHWRRPAAYLDPQVRACCSGLAQADQEVVDRAMQDLAIDIDSGAWGRRDRELLALTDFDAGFRLVVSTEF
jgi:SAM-dependent methyltransferase